MQEQKVRMAIMDMNNDEPNQGLRCIVDIAKSFESSIEFEVFNVRAAVKLPDDSFDIYISSGGPGSPLEEAPWRAPYLEFVQRLWNFNETSKDQKKFVFFICFSFQVVCDYFQLGSIQLRRSTSFGIFPIHKTKMGMKDHLFDALDNPFYAVDSRDWQLIQPKLKVFEEHGATILSLEKIRSNVEYERAIMAVRFSKEFVGTQFHPEADPESMKTHFSQDVNKQIVIDNFGPEKYNLMMLKMDDPDKLSRTYQAILPNFIKGALVELTKSVTS